MQTQNTEWRYGWSTLLGALGGMMTVGAASSITGLVMKPLEVEFGWSRAEITGSILIVSLCAFVMAPIAGSAIRRYGSRAVALASFFTTALGFILIGMSGPSIWTWFAAWTVFGLMSAALGPIVWTSAVSNLFDRSRGMALSVALSGGGLAYAVWPPLVAPLLSNFGWRGAYFALAAIALAVMLPLNWFALRDRRPVTPQGTSTHAQALGDVWGMTLHEALRGTRFWRLVVALILMAGINGSLVIHFFPILSERNIPAQEAAFLTACIGPAMIGGRLATGYLIDRLFAPAVAAVATALPIVTSLVLLSATTSATAALAAVTVGVSTGSAGCTIAFLVGKYFGLRHYASIFGVLIATYGLGFGFFPVVTGHFFDVSGTYTPLLGAFMVGVVPAAVLIGSLGRYTRSTAFAERAPPPAPALES